MSVTSGVKLDASVKERLQALGAKMERSPHWLMKTAIEHYVTEQERYWKEREEDEQRWENYLATGNGTPHAQARNWLSGVGTEDERPCPK